MRGGAVGHDNLSGNLSTIICKRQAGRDARIGAVASVTAAETKRAALSRAVRANIFGSRQSESMPQATPRARL
jgi:hypothetical protein